MLHKNILNIEFNTGNYHNIKVLDSKKSNVTCVRFVSK